MDSKEGARVASDERDYYHVSARVRQRERGRRCYLLLGLLPNNPVLVDLLLAILGLFIAFPALLLAVAIGEAAEQLAGLRRDTVNPARVDLDAPVQRAAGLLEVDAVTLLQQRHVVEVVDERKVPRVISVDLVVRRHLHPLLEIGEDRHPLHGRHGTPSHHDVVVVIVGPSAAGATARGLRVRAGRGGRHPAASLPRGRREFYLVDLGVLEGLSRM